MKREISVTAHRTVTEFDKDESLVSTVELRLPAEELKFMGEVLQAQKDDKDVRCTLLVRNSADGGLRKLGLKLKNSKMKDFVPVAIFTKWGNSTDNLTELFDTGTYGNFELVLLTEIVERQGEEPMDFDAEPVTPSWVLAELQQDELAQERMLGEGCPHCPDVINSWNVAHLDTQEEGAA